jgi:HTH-type transcriptional regulator / antitoxin MqsA
MTSSDQPAHSPNQFCLDCDNGAIMSHAAKDLSFSYRAKGLTVAQVQGWHCPQCGECQFDPGEGQRFSAACDAFCAAQDREMAVTLRATRKKLGLRQAEAGRLFGGGASAFSEYERGKTQPHKSTVLLLKLLDRHPDLLPEVMEAA